MTEYYRLTDKVTGGVWGNYPPPRKQKEDVTLNMGDIDIFIHDECKDNVILKVRVTSELKFHFAGDIPYDSLCDASKAVIERFALYCDEQDKKIAR